MLDFCESSSEICISVGKTLEEIERLFILKTLHHFDGNRTLSANCLGISLKGLRLKLKEYKMKGFAIPPAKSRYLKKDVNK